MVKLALLTGLASIILFLGIHSFAQEVPHGAPSPLLPFTLPRMVSPEIDVPGQPFSYPSQPTDQIGVMGARFGTEITPEGYLYTGYGELMFFLGIDRIPLKQRIRTLEDGYLPIVNYTQSHDGLDYRFTVFAASLGLEQNGMHVMNFVRVTVHNPTRVLRRGYVTSAWRYQGDQTTSFATGDNRFRRPVPEKVYGGYEQEGETFNPSSIYTVHDGAFLRDGKAIYLFPQSPAAALARSYRGYYGRVMPFGSPIEDGKLVSVLPTTPVALAEYALDVPPGEDRTLDFKMPLEPMDPRDSLFVKVQRAQFDELHRQVCSFWKDIVARGMQIETPEDKVNDTFRTSLVNDLLALNRSADNTIQTINQLHYHGFYLRDSSDFVRMYDTTGYADIGRKIAEFASSSQSEDGNFLSQPGQYDGWGYALLTFGAHYRYTHDKAFAAAIYPRVVSAVGWLEHATAVDPLHLIPATDVHDNEYIPGHLTGYNFLALDGLQSAELLAHDLGHPDDERHFRHVEQDLRTAFLNRLDVVTKQTGGYIPPALDGDMGGADWGNLLSLTPGEQLSPTDPRVFKTLHTVQSKYQEGLMTYHEPRQGLYLHHYLTIKNTLTELIVGEQEQATRELYAELVHTTATNGGFEFSIRPWADRDFSGNLSPHGWFAADFRNLLRNMMVREEGQTLHLLSDIAPAWVGMDKRLVVRNAVTYFGRVSFTLNSDSSDSVVLHLYASYDAGYAPQHVLLHLPWFMSVQSVTIDGVPAIAKNGIVELPLQAHEIRWKWTARGLPPDFPASYADAVEQYRSEYQKVYLKRTTPGE